MKFKTCIIMLCIFYNFNLFPSSLISRSSSVSSRLVIPFTPNQLKEKQEKQAAVISTEKNVLEVGTAATVCSVIDEEFIFGTKKYREVELSDFYKEYSDVIASFKEEATSFFRLADEDELIIYNHLKANPGKREFLDFKFKIVLEMPSIPSSKNNRDWLFNTKLAKEYAIEKTEKFIEDNYDQVRARCVGLPLKERCSKVVLSPGCCDLQVHEGCFEQYKTHKIRKCINSFCKGSTQWDDSFYAKVCKERPVVQENEIRDADCPVCMEPLKQDLLKQESFYALFISWLLQCCGRA
ncbi:MAG: hypothetical protein JO129_03390 [Candidatus Dependentiae bacterium]|nr:hypothetical protein [Candidatus Dependentiae bacterium]